MSSPQQSLDDISGFSDDVGLAKPADAVAQSAYSLLSDPMQLEAAAFLVLLLDAEYYQVLHANAAAEAAARSVFQHESIIGKSVLDLGDAHSADWLRKDLIKATATGQSIHGHNDAFTFCNGEIRRFDCSIVPFPNSSGQIDRLLLISSDVTARARLWEVEAANQRIRDLELLNELTRAVHGTRDWLTSLDTLIAHIQQIRPCKIVTIAHYDEASSQRRTVRSNVDCAFGLATGEPVSVAGTDFERAALGMQVIYVPDIRSSPSPVQGMLLKAGYHAVLHVPLVFEGQLQGVLTLIRAAPDSFCPEDIAFFEQVGAHGAVALRNASFHAEQQILLDRERRLMQISGAINSSIDLPAVLTMTYEAVMEAGGFDRVGLMLFNPDTGTIQGVVGTDSRGNIDRLEFAQLEFSLTEDGAKQSETLRLLEGTWPYLLGTEYETSSRSQVPLPETGDHAHIALMARGRAVGMISVDNMISKRPISRGEIETLLPLCEQAAARIYVARLLAERNEAQISAERQAKREHLVNAISRAVSSTLEPEEVIKRVIREVKQLGSYMSVSMAQPLEVPGTWKVIAADSDQDLPDWPKTLFIGGEAALRQGTDAVLHCRSDVAEDGGVMSAELAALGVGSLLQVELLMSSSSLGMLILLSRERNGFSNEDLTLMETLAPSLAVALHNADLCRSLKQAQEALIRAETLRAVGELAGGVAHNVNNLLAAVMGYSELIQTEVNDPEAVMRDAKVIAAAAADGANIVQRIQQFAREAREELRDPIDVSVLLEDVISFTRALWFDEASARGAKIEVIKELSPELIVDGHLGELREVFVNLVRNACDAMPTGGILSVSCQGTQDEITVEVKDTGIGIEENTRKRIFEPFFTTKGVERGLGLGLSVSWRAIDRLGGRIDVKSEPGRGSTLTVRMPRSKLPRTQVTKRHGAEVHVLLAEDEDFLRDVMSRGLKNAGLNVHAVADGVQALSWLEKTNGDCNVVLSDHGMPGMTGLELLAETRHRYPRIRRILISGWGLHPPGGESPDAAEVLLSKPITMRSLVETVTVMLATHLT